MLKALVARVLRNKRGGLLERVSEEESINSSSLFYR